MASHPQIQPRTSPKPGTRTGSAISPGTNSKPEARTSAEADPRTSSEADPWTGSEADPWTSPEADPWTNPEADPWTGSEADRRTSGFGCCDELGDTGAGSEQVGSGAGRGTRGSGGGNNEFGDIGAGFERVGSGCGPVVGSRSGSKADSSTAEEAECAAKSPQSGSKAGSGAGSASAAGGGGWEWHADRVEAGFTALNAVAWSELPKTELREVMAKLTLFKANADALLCAVTAAVSSIEGKADAAETLRQLSHMSLHDARRFERVGSQLADMPNTSQRLSAGEITLDHATEMAKAAELVGAAEVDSDDTLLNSASNSVAERFAEQVKTWTRDHLEDRGEDLHQTQRRRRRGLLFVDKSSGMGVLHAEFDEIAFGLIRQAVDTRAHAMLNQNTTAGVDGLDGSMGSGPAANSSADSGPAPNSSMGSSPAVDGLAGSGPAAGGSVDAGGTQTVQTGRYSRVNSLANTSAGVCRTQTCSDTEHENGQRQLRNLTQCRADAVFELVTGRSADTPHPPIAGETARAGTQLLIVADIGVIDGTNPADRCEIVGTGAVPPRILAQLSPDTKLAAMIFDGRGQPLWLGRSRRHHNTHQYLAVAVRDAGCVECRAPMHVCDIHHTRPWSKGGPTDINNLVALCGHHHRQTHTTNSASPSPASPSPASPSPSPVSPSPDTYQQPLLC